MLVDIQIVPKTLEAILKFDIVNFTSDKSFKDAIATITMVAADYSLDPELEVEDLQEMITKAKSDSKKTLVFSILEDGIEAELTD